MLKYASGLIEMKKSNDKLESDMEEAAKQGIIELVAIMSTSLTIAGKQYRMRSIAEKLTSATSEEED